MAISDPSTVEEFRNVIARIVEQGADAQSIQASLRLSRLKLGVAMERLEVHASRTDLLAKVHALALSVAAEIDALVEVVLSDAAN
jgi:hypothetical protein